MDRLKSIANDFYYAFYEKKWTGNNKEIKGLTLEEAYVIQDLVTQKRIDSGEKVLGYKVGCTSNAIRAQFGLDSPINGKLFFPHVMYNQAKFDFSDYINCAIEPEMVIKIKQELKGINIPDEQLIDAIAYVSPGIEIHEFHFWQQPPTMQELICTGGIHTGLIVGNQKVQPNTLNFKDEIFSVFINKSLETTAPCSEAMGGALNSLRWLVNFLTAKGNSLAEGSLVIPGSPVELVSINQPVELEINIDKVGSTRVVFDKKT